jgi:tRNA pseudouridine38-40 synthase
MVRYQIILAYDGSLYKGFQRQAKARSVQGELESALRRLNWQGRAILAAGRTDTGAHATGQVVAFDLDWPHPINELQQALNGLLPADMAVQSIRTVNPSFHPRYQATWRRYRYQIYCQAVRQPLLDHNAWQVWPAAELSRLQEAASLLIGTHDFAAFGTPPRPVSSTVRTVFQAAWWEQTPYLVFEITAQAFLYHMVRRLVHTQVQVGQARLEPEQIRQALQAPEALPGKSNLLRHGLAPACGLTLVAVGYPPEVLSPDEDLDLEQLTTDTDVSPSKG